MKQNKVLEMLHKARSFNKYIFSALDVSLSCELNKTQRGALMFIAIEGPVAMNEVSERFGLEKGSFTQVADSLEALSLIERKRCDKDRRIIYLETTEKGKEVANNIHAATEARIESLINQLPIQRKQEFLDCIDRISEDINTIMKGNKNV